MKSDFFFQSLQVIILSKLINKNFVLMSSSKSPSSPVNYVINH